MGAMAPQIINPAIVYSTVYSGADQRKHQSSASLVFVRGIHRWPVNSPHKGPVTRKMFPFDDVIKIRPFSLFYKTNICNKSSAWLSHFKEKTKNYARGLTIVMLWRGGLMMAVLLISSTVSSLTQFRILTNIQWNMSVTTTSIMRFITCD